MAQAGIHSSSPAARVLFLLCRHQLAWNRPLPAADSWRADRRALGLAHAEDVEEGLADAVDGEGGGKAKPGREYCAGDQARGEEAGRLAARGIARWAHRICVVKRIPLNGSFTRFPRCGKQRQQVSPW
jgi:hypothetical protein